MKKRGKETKVTLWMAFPLVIFRYPESPLTTNITHSKVVRSRRCDRQDRFYIIIINFNEIKGKIRCNYKKRLSKSR